MILLIICIIITIIIYTCLIAAGEADREMERLMSNKEE